MPLSDYVHRDYPEIVIGLVGPTGVDLGQISGALSEALQLKGYDDVVEIHLTDFFDRFEDEIEVDLQEDREDRRILSYQEAGNQIRELLETKDAIAQEACLQIYFERQSGEDLPDEWVDEAEAGGDDEDNNGHLYETQERTAYILRSFKLPEEVALLRSVYGDAFVLLAGHAPRDSRIETIEWKIAAQEGDDDGYESGGDYRGPAETVIKRDEAQIDRPHGQNLRHTFPLADAFLDASDSEQLSTDITRTVKLLFGNPWITPTKSEHCMFIAESSRLRSSVAARQVGACLARPNGEVVSTGCNEVPHPGGGLYWSDHRWDEDEADERGFQREENTVREKREDTLQEVLEGLASIEDIEEFDWLDVDIEQDEIEDGVSPLLDHLSDENARIAGLIEFFRTTHAEMEAILGAARRGQPVEGSTLYSTTFPCHECTRHIVTSGVNEVVYIEPYPKSLGPDLHDDAVAVDEEPEEHQIPFKQFTGIGPRLYRALLTIEKRKNHGIPGDHILPGDAPVVGLRQPGTLLNEAEVVQEYVERIGESPVDFDL